MAFSCSAMSRQPMARPVSRTPPLQACRVDPGRSERRLALRRVSFATASAMSCCARSFFGCPAAGGWPSASASRLDHPLPRVRQARQALPGLGLTGPARWPAPTSASSASGLDLGLSIAMRRAARSRALRMVLRQRAGDVAGIGLAKRPSRGGAPRSLGDGSWPRAGAGASIHAAPPW